MREVDILWRTGRTCVLLSDRSPYVHGVLQLALLVIYHLQGGGLVARWIPLFRQNRTGCPKIQDIHFFATGTGACRSKNEKYRQIASADDEGGLS